MFDQPLVGVAQADDSLYTMFKKPEIIGENYLTPVKWLKSARSVISIFNPFTQRVKKSNIAADIPSAEWLHGRIEGQTYVLSAAQELAEYLRANGAETVVPVADERFNIFKKPKLYSNWSERHAAYTAGLGTFSLNRAIITSKGIAGRFCSVITDI